MRALFFLNAFAGGGAERVCLNLAGQLHRMGIESDFITIYDAKTDYDVPDYIYEFCLGVDADATFIKTLKCIFKGRHEMTRFISGKRYLLVTAHLQPSGFAAFLTRVGKKCLYVVHTSQHLEEKYDSCIFYRAGIRLFFRGKKVITVSKGLREELICECKVLPENVTVIYNPGDVQTAQDITEQVSPHKKPYILFMGRLEEEKDPLMALELFYRGKFYDKYNLVYLGQGSLEERVRKRIAEYHLEKSVYLSGFQKNPERWIKQASLLLSCSKWEGMPMNLIEALLCGTPIVAADCPYGVNEILTDEMKRYLIQPEKDFEKSIAVISSALSSYPKITEKYYRKFDGILITQKYLKVWEAVFNQKGR